jgi:cytoskeletal protein RodZ
LLFNDKILIVFTKDVKSIYTAHTQILVKNADMRLSGNLILGLLAVNGLAQTLVPDQGQEPSAIAQPEPSPPAAEEPSVPVQDQPSVPADDDDTSRTDAEEAPEATPVPEPTADTPEETADASQISEGDQPTATASDDNDDEATTAAEETATADGEKYH